MQLRFSFRNPVPALARTTTTAAHASNCPATQPVDRPDDFSRESLLGGWSVGTTVRYRGTTAVVFLYTRNQMKEPRSLILTSTFGW